MRPICTACERTYQPEKGGVTVIEVHGHDQEPYALWSADLFKCPSCGHQIVGGFASRQYASHWEDGFSRLLDAVKDRKDKGPYYLREFPLPVAAS